MVIRRAGNTNGPSRVVTKGGSSFVETPYTVTVPGVNNCGWLLRLAGAIYMTCDFKLGLVIKDGVVAATPIMIPLTGIDRFLNVSGLPIRIVPGLVVWVAGDGVLHKFIRHNGVK